MDVIIRLRGIAKAYRLGQALIPALAAVDLDLDGGQVAALCGPSGSGKSTLLNICGLLDQADAGEYRLQGRDVAGLSGRQRTELRRHHIGFVFQGFNLVPVMTARENVEYPLLLSGVGARERRERVGRMLEQVGLAHCAEQLPDRLSGGQRQRVAIARALVKRPALVIADEPTANLDSATASQVIDLMAGFAREQGVGFLVATHDERMTARCDRVLRLRDGRIAQEDARAVA